VITFDIYLYSCGNIHLKSDLTGNVKHLIYVSALQHKFYCANISILPTC